MPVFADAVGVEQSEALVSSTSWTVPAEVPLMVTIPSPAVSWLLNV
jgi:hypothetical protein